MNRILYFSAEWCGPCKVLGPVMEELRGEINYQKIDVDKNQDLSIQYGVRNIPTLILLDETGEVKGRKTGLQTKSDILAFYHG